MSGLKRFLANKNTVTILGVLAIILVVYIGYNMRVSAAVSPQPVPYAKKTIQPRTRITEDMIGIAQIPPGLIKGKIITKKDDVIGLYTNVNTIVPEGSLFYRDAVVPKQQLADVAVMDLPKGYILFNLPVDVKSTYGNSVMPGNYIDIYYKGLDDNKTLMYGVLLRNVKILAVKDAKGQNVFENSEESRIPAMLLFGLPDELQILLRKAIYLKDYGAELIPIPTNNSLSKNPGKLKLAGQVIADFIESKTVAVPLDQILSETEDLINPDITSTR